MVSVRTAAVAEPVGDVAAELGEGPYWVPEDDCLLWVDIRRGQLHRTYFPSGETVTMDLGAVSAAFPAVGGGILTAGGSQARPAPARGAGGAVDHAGHRGSARADGIRFNDAAVDPAGRVWVGSMDIDESEPLGELFRLDAGGVLTTVVKGVTVSNGLGWSPDSVADVLRRLPDPPDRRVRLQPRRGRGVPAPVFADLSAFDGVPDGLTVDADGYVWVAMGGGVLRRFAPDGTWTRCCDAGLAANELCFRRPGNE